MVPKHLYLPKSYNNKRAQSASINSYWMDNSCKSLRLTKSISIRFHQWKIRFVCAPYNSINLWNRTHSERKQAMATCRRGESNRTGRHAVTDEACQTLLCAATRENLNFKWINIGKNVVMKFPLISDRIILALRWHVCIFYLPYIYILVMGTCIDVIWFS